jgi:hypothetical protein
MPYRFLLVTRIKFAKIEFVIIESLRQNETLF